MMFAVPVTMLGSMLAPWGVEPMPALPADVPEPWLSLMLSPGTRILAFVWGLLWGSFANVLIYRLPRGLSFVRPRSRCPHCEHPVAAWDNIPVVSFLVLRGRCRHCKEPLSLRYLVVELLCGILSFALYMQFVYVPLLEGKTGDPIAWALWLAFGIALLVVTYIDLDFWIIPPVIVLPLAGVGIVAAVLDPSVLGVPWPHALGAAAGGFLLFAGIGWYYRRFRSIEGLGLGDAQLLLMVGAFTGPVGLLWTIAAGALQGLVVSVPMLLAGKKIANTDLHEVHGDDPELGEDDPDRITGQRVPFGPFLALAAMEYLLLQRQIRSVLTWWVEG
jgi:leader peptidase (prepilin peptidase)/N-methyltransferase